MERIFQFCIPKYKSMLRVENLSFSYDKLPVLESINLRIQRGEHVAIMD